MKAKTIFSFFLLVFLCACGGKSNNTARASESTSGDIKSAVKDDEKITTSDNLPEKVVIEKDFLYDQHTLQDTYAYGKNGTREFQWDKIEKGLAYIDSFQRKSPEWAIIQNRGNKNGQAPLVYDSKTDSYNRAADQYGVEEYQGIPFYSTADASKPERYGWDGSLVKIISKSSDSLVIENINFAGKWIVPEKYVYTIPDSVQYFSKVICVDKTNQNIATMEKVGSKWLVRSMNPATTGAHHPPYQHETPSGIFVVQQKKPRMLYYVDGTTEIAGYAPYASRFCDGAYTHGVPVNNPNGAMVEFSATLGTIPRSHMCVRNATSHAKFIYEWAPVNKALVFVFE